MFSHLRSIKVISFVGQRPQMDEYFSLLKEQGSRYVVDIANPYFNLSAEVSQNNERNAVAVL
ncbi:MAG: hypothetical protein ACLP29_13925 [Dissulfurispiraceae bacterium]